MKYYPKSHIKIGQFTKGEEWMYRDGTEYKGPYWVTIDGKVGSGANRTSTSVPLIPYKNVKKTKINYYASNIYDDLPKKTNVKGMKQPVATYPDPDDKDYKKGYFTRYFLRKTNDLSDPIREVTSKEFTRVRKSKVGYYNTGTILDWKISGPKFDVTEDGKIIQSGIVDTNRRTLHNKNMIFPGIIRRLPNLLEHSNYQEIANIDDFAPEQKTTNTPPSQTSPQSSGY